MIVLIFTSLQQVHGPLNPPPAAADNNPRMFHVGDHALLKLKLHAGDVSVQTADSDTLTVEPRKHGTLNAPDYTSVHILYDQITNAQGHQELTVHTDPWLREIDFAITIPQTTSLQLALDSGSIDVHGGQGITASTESGTLDLEDINGPVDVHTTNGDITAKNIHGAVKLDGQNGSLHLQKIQGAVKATTTSGDVIAREMAMSGQSLLQTQNGSIRFDGSIDPKGAYTLTTTNGDVDLTLPSTSSFSLDATTTNGSVQNAFGSTNVGTSPQALLKLHTQNGSLHLISQP
ncbi:hypothetical protein KTT_57450 [Tengunoibacter tsumagoiensis]|uniref:DUF4097 domain-containing protein n=2 Tax=Tengunoibacter tsumagoiensis TaxID=2014871 RepID=A0A402AA27_9CHLR|nr:hypothetical protein KTT_57450 [Tengunoibacter tsumagoiensis]